MKSTTVRFELIQSLGAKERSAVISFFWMLSEREEKNYYRLFVAIEAQSSYDETALMEKLGYDQKKLASTKYYLQQTILTALRQFHWKRGYEYEIWAACVDAELLLHKGLYELAQRRIHQAEKINSEKPAAFYAAKIYELKAKLSLRPSELKDPTFETLDNLTTLSSKSIMLSDLQLTCQNMLRQLNLATFYKYEVSSTFVERINLFVLANIEKKDVAVRTMILTLNLQYQLLMKANQLVLSAFGRVVSEKQSAHKTAFNADVVESLYWALDYFLNVGDRAMISQVIEMVRATNKGIKDKSDPFLIIETLLITRIKLNFGERFSQQVLSRVSKQYKSSQVPKAKNELPFSVQLEHLYWNAADLMRHGLYKKAIMILLEVESWHSIKKVPQVALVAIRLCILICLFELKRFSELGERHRELILFIQQCDRLHEHELMFINSMRRVKAFDSLNAERGFYEAIMDRLKNEDCQNRYLLLGNAPLTSAWLNTRTIKTT